MVLLSLGFGVGSLGLSLLARDIHHIVLTEAKPKRRTASVSLAVAFLALASLGTAATRSRFIDDQGGWRWMVAGLGLAALGYLALRHSLLSSSALHPSGSPGDQEW